MKSILLVTLFIVGCGIPGRYELLESTPSCLGPYFIKDGVGHLDGAKLAVNEKLLKYMFTHQFSYPTVSGDDIYVQRPLMRNSEEFCNTFESINITYVWGYDFPCDGSTCWGYTTLSGGITLEYSGNSLAHELLHIYEAKHGILNTATHPYWDEKGYNFFNDILWVSQENRWAMSGPNNEKFPMSADLFKEGVR